MLIRRIIFAPAALLLVIGCGDRGSGRAAAVMDAAKANADSMRRGDTISVPAAAVDTTTNRPAGVASGTAAPGAAVGIDTPITRKLGSPSTKKR